MPAANPKPDELDAIAVPYLLRLHVAGERYIFTCHPDRTVELARAIGEQVCAGWLCIGEARLLLERLSAQMLRHAAGLGGVACP